MRRGKKTETFESLQDSAPKLFNFDDAFDVTLFDKFTRMFYHGEGEQNQLAKKVLEEFLKDDRSWCRVDTILEFSKSDESRFYALLILEKLAKSRWRLLPPEQRTGIRDYMIQQIVNIGNIPFSLESRKMYINKLVCLIVEIIKLEWPGRWPNFTDEIVQSSRANENLCLINMKILRLLGEEIFIFSSSQMSHLKANYLKETLRSKFSSLFDLIFNILNTSTNTALIVETLRAFSSFVEWIDVSFIFETSIISILMERLLKEPQFANDTLGCLANIMDLNSLIYNYKKKDIYLNVLEKIKEMLPYTFNMNLVYSKGTEIQQIFLHKMALFFSQSLKDYTKLFDSDKTIKLLVEGLEYLLALTSIEETEIFKITIEFWRKFTESVHLEHSLSFHRVSTPNYLYLPHLTSVLTRLRQCLITHMKRPEEVIIYVNEVGEVVRQVMRDTESVNLYNICKETLTYLTRLKPEEVRDMILENLAQQMAGPDWSWHQLNSIGWAVGSISGAMDTDMEREFLVTVLKNLLTLCEIKSGKDNKAVIASNIMYVVQQYPRFLKPYPKFLKTVVNKLFEFMHETHEGVQDMACDAFLKIAKSCKYKLCEVQQGDALSYIESVSPTLAQTFALLNINQLEIVYEGVGTIISAIDNPGKCKRLITQCLENGVSYWKSFLGESKMNNNIWTDTTRLQTVCQFLKISNSMCKAVGEIFEVVLSQIMPDLLNAYALLSSAISHKLSTLGVEASLYSDVKVMRSFKRDTLTLFDSWISNSPNYYDMIKTSYFPMIVQNVLADYSSSDPSVREVEVLSLAISLIDALRGMMNDNILILFQHLFDSTLCMINKDLEEFPEHRIKFFKLIEAIANHCFSSLIRLNQVEFDFVMQSLFFGMTQTMPNVAATGLGSLIIIFRSIPDLTFSDSAFGASFYKTYYISILDQVLHLVTDGLHGSDFTDHAFILSHLFGLVETGHISYPLFESSACHQDNKDYIKQHTVVFLKQKFEHLSEKQLILLLNGMFCYAGDQQKFMQHLKDFVIQLKECQGDTNEELFFAKELEWEMQQAASSQTINDASKPMNTLPTSQFLQDYHTVP